MFGRLWKWLAASKDAPVGKVIARFVRPGEAGRPVYTDTDRWRLAEDGYKRSSLIFSCIHEFSSSIAEAPLIAEDTSGNRLPATDGLSQLLANINREMTPYDYVERICTDIKIHGECIVHLLRSKAGIIREMWPLRVDRVEVIPAPTGEISHYLVNGEAKIDPADIMHFKLPNPTNDYRGLSPLYVLMVEGQLDKDAILYLGEFFRNGGLPSVVITSTQELMPGDKKTIREDYAEVYGRRGGVLGNTGWHQPMVLSNGATLQPLGIDPSKLDLAPIFDAAESRVCSVLGVPAIIVGARIGLLQAQAYGTAREARRDWWGKDLVPFTERLAQWHTKRIAREFGVEKAIRFDLSEVQALLEARVPVEQSTSLIYSQSMITRDEARKRIGMDAIDGGSDVFKWQLDRSKATPEQALAESSGQAPAAEMVQ